MYVANNYSDLVSGIHVDELAEHIRHLFDIIELTKIFGNWGAYISKIKNVLLYSFK